MTETLDISVCLIWIKDHNGVSFAELQRWLDKRNIETKGTYALEPLPNVIIWGGVSERFCDIFHELKPHLDLKPMGLMEALLVYTCDGMMPQLPIAKRPPKNGYAKPHWLPVYLKPKQPHKTRADIRASLLRAREEEL